MSPTEPPEFSSGHPPPGFPKWIHAFACGGILALVLLLVGVSSYDDGQNVWQDWTEAGELRRPDDAGRIHPEDFLRTGANTWSNLAYILAGFYAVGLAGHDARRTLPGTADSR